MSGWYDRLCLWYIHGDRRLRKTPGDFDLLIRKPVMQAAIRQAAKEEGREHEQYPWENGLEHEERVKNVLR